MDKDIMRVSVDTLIQEQIEFLKSWVADKLKTIETLWEEENYKEIENMLGFSPGGDEMGEDNYFINFGYGDGSLAKDIKRIIDEINALKRRK